MSQKSGLYLQDVAHFFLFPLEKDNFSPNHLII